MFTLKKIERLCSKKAIDALFNSGKSKTQFPIKLMYRASEFESEYPARAMFVVPKKKHKRANKRNTLKRRMREAYRLNKHELYSALTKQKIDIMFIYLSHEEQDYQSIEKTIQSLIKHLINQVSEISEVKQED